ncbi:MAG: hypothetical protein JXR22_14015 [Prolixibacteraceae bacterium]|nr:hypothetical protein [Prolixibacteraceae bacterium]
MKHGIYTPVILLVLFLFSCKDSILQPEGNADPLKTGQYWIRMIVPGLSHQLSKPEERFLKDGRIWLGQMELFQKIEIE